MIISRSQTYHHHLNYTDKVKITCSDKSVERVKEYKLLGLIINKKIKLNSHDNKDLKDGYATLTTLTFLKQYIYFNVRKQLCGSLISTGLLPYSIQNINYSKHAQDH